MATKNGGKRYVVRRAQISGYSYVVDTQAPAGSDPVMAPGALSEQDAERYARQLETAAAAASPDRMLADRLERMLGESFVEWQQTLDRQRSLDLDEADTLVLAYQNQVAYVRGALGEIVRQLRVAS